MVSIPRNHTNRDSELVGIMDLIRNITLITRIISKSYKSGISINKSNPGWDSFKRSRKIRNRLTHPKIPKSLTISDNDLQVLNEAEKWFLDWYLRLLNVTGFHE